MVESSKEKFVKLSQKEIHSKISNLAASKESIKVWIKGSSQKLYKMVEVSSNLPIEISLFKEDEEDTFIDHEVLINFKFNNIDFFSKGFIYETSDFLKLKLADDIYKSERRAVDRLLTYPHDQFYVYFKINVVAEPSEDNIVCLNSYKKDKKSVALDRIPEEFSDGEDDLFGFRVMDLSKDGFSILVNASELNSFKDGEKLLSCKFIMSGLVFNLKEVRTVHTVSFIDSREKKSTKYKVGMNFRMNPKLGREVSKIIEERDLLGMEVEDFEEYIDD